MWLYAVAVEALCWVSARFEYRTASKRGCLQFLRLAGDVPSCFTAERSSLWPSWFKLLRPSFPHYISAAASCSNFISVEVTSSTLVLARVVLCFSVLSPASWCHGGFYCMDISSRCPLGCLSVEAEFVSSHLVQVIELLWTMVSDFHKPSLVSYDDSAVYPSFVLGQEKRSSPSVYHSKCTKVVLAVWILFDSPL
ncbi:hypothetical protein Bca101_059542 [Brassica carinata]